MVCDSSASSNNINLSNGLINNGCIVFFGNGEIIIIIIVNNNKINIYISNVVNFVIYHGSINENNFSSLFHFC